MRMSIEQDKINQQAVANFPLELEALVVAIRAWGKARNITLNGGATSLSQRAYAGKELIETSYALGVSVPVYGFDFSEVTDGIGDTLVCIIQARRLNGIPIGTTTLTILNATTKAKTIEIQDVPLDYLQRAMNQVVLGNDAKATEHLIEFANCFVGLVAPTLEQVIITCLNKAWNDIKDRKGSMVDGQFIREN